MVDIKVEGICMNVYISSHLSILSIFVRQSHLCDEVLDDSAPRSPSDSSQ